MDNITETTKFLSQTINDFQNYIKDEKIKKEFYLEESISKILNIIRGSLINHDIEIELTIDKTIKIISIQNELNQVLLNILNNSKDALKEIEYKKLIYINVYKKEDLNIIEIIDNAGGINKNIINKIFEPYFTTKHKSQGTGLGLYMTHKIVKESLNGEILINNITYKEFNKCTQVIIHLKDKI